MSINLASYLSIPVVGAILQSRRSAIARSLACQFAATIAIISTLSPALGQSITPANDGTGTNVNSNANQINISGGTQAGNNLFHSFQQFGLDAGQIANFLSNPNIHNILGRVTGGNASVINGLVQVTGGNSNLYLMNPAGIIFGANSSLNVPASFTATTATGIGFGNNNWFNATGANNYTALTNTPSSFAFNLTQPGSIINAGNLAVPTGENLSLIAGNVINTGTLTAAGGNITVAAVPGTSLVKISQPGNVLSLEINPQTTANATAITPQTLPQLLTGKEPNLTNGITLNSAGQAVFTNGTIIVDGGSAISSGNLNTASNQIGGKVQVLGNTVKLIDAHINANGDSGGGTVLIGGDYQGLGTVPTAQTTVIDSHSVIHADAINSGNGGKVIAWADHSTYFHGEITARGGLSSGNGGLIETSGKQYLSVKGASVDALAPQGIVGTWLLDPRNIIVQAGGSATLAQVGNAGDTTNNFTIDPTTINSATANVILAASDSITFNSPINMGNAGVGLTANAGGDINLNASITSNGGDINLNNSGVFSLNNGATLNTSGTGNITLRQNLPGKIQAAVDAIGILGTGTATINLGAGTFTDINAAVVGVVGKRLTIRGVGSGTDAATSTIVDGQQSRQAFNISGTGANVSIDNLRVANGGAAFGGGIFVDAGTALNLSNSALASNSAFNGGGIYNNGTTNISNSTLSGNQASTGGGIYNNGTAHISNSTLSDNQATTGGGISNSGTAHISNSTLSKNKAIAGGGGISNVGTAHISNSIFSSNQAGNDGGGGIINSGIANISNSTLSSNSAFNGGGILNAGTANISSSTLSSNQAGNNGGGILNTGNGTANISNSTLSSNSAFEGGGISNVGTATINNSTLSGNQVSTGGGISNVGTAHISNSTFSSNSAFNGGGISNQGTTNISNSTFSSNSAFNGGGISNQGTTNISNSTLSSNQASNNGGGIYNFFGTTNISNSTLSSNQATTNGGGIYNLVRANISNSTLSSNSARTYGGGIYNLGTANISNSTLSSNSATEGGGIRNDFNSRADISNSTLSSNSARTYGGGIFYNFNSTTTIRNSIVAGNTASIGTEVYRLGLSGTFTSQGYNLVGQNGTAGGFPTTSTDIILQTSINKVLAPLGNYGGTTQTHALLPGSPAIDAGNNSLIPSGVTTDQRGVNRIFNSTVDIGAFESQGYTFSAIAGNGQSTTVNTPFATALQVKLTENGFNQPLPGASVAFSAPSTGASANFSSINSVTTDSNGIATAPLTANTQAGTYQAVASIGNLNANFNLTNNPDVAAIISIFSGDNQSAVVANAFTTNLQVKITDQYNNPIPNATVSFATSSTGASANFSSNNSVTTDNNGIATASTLTANTQAGTYQATATSGNLNTNFNLTNNPDVAATISILDGDNQSTVVANNFTTNLQVRISDRYNNPIPNATVSFATPTTGASANFSSSNSVITNSLGIATASTLTANTQAGTYQATANSGNLNANFNLTNNPDVAAIISILGGDNQSTVVANNFTTNLQVRISDRYNNPIPNATVSFAAPATGASANFSSSNSVTTNSSGIATASTLTANTQAGTYQATANSGALNANFNLANNPDQPFSIIATSGNNQSTIVNNAFANALQVTVKDKFGNPVPNSLITFSVPSSGASALFTGTNTINTNNLGIASINLIANASAGDFIATANFGTLSPTNFNLTINSAPTPVPIAIAPTPAPQLIAPPEYENLRQRMRSPLALRFAQSQPKFTRTNHVAFFYPHDEILNVLDTLLPEIIAYMNKDGGTLSINLDEFMPISNPDLLLASENQITIKRYLIKQVRQLIGAEFVEFVDVNFNNEQQVKLIINVKKSPQKTVLKK